MSQLIKRGNKYYIYYFKNGKYRGKTTKTSDLQAAKNLQNKFDNELLNTNSDIKQKPLWTTFVKEYLEFAQANKRPRSINRDTRTLKIFSQNIDIKYFSEYNFQMLERYKALRKKARLMESSINRELNTLKAMGKWAVKANYSPTNPVEGVKKYSETKTAKDRYLSLKEIKILLTKPKSLEVKIIVRFGLWAGTRLGEALHMTWDDIDFDKNLVYFTPKDGWRPKTLQKQVIPLNSKLKAFLLTLERNGKYICGTDPMKEESASAVIRKVFDSLGIKDASSHTLRHTAISYLAMAGADFPSIVRFARHTTPTHTMRYTHLMPSYSQNIVDKLPY